MKNKDHAALMIAAKKIIDKKNTDRSDRITEYFRARPFLSPLKLAGHIGYSKSNLSEIINRKGNHKYIAAEYLDAFESILKDYGFKPRKSPSNL